MTAFGKTWLCCASLLLLLPFPALAADAPVPPPAVRDGTHDFDFGIGVFKTHIKRLTHPLTGSTSWTEWNGSVATRKLWDGKGQMEELEFTGADGTHVQGITVRLYNPVAHQWNLYWVDSDDGTMAQPMIGEFKDGKGVFYDQEQINGRAVLVRNVYWGMTPGSYHFEQAFSADAGKTWEPNFVASLTREAKDVSPEAEAPGLSADEHAFDWQFGSWDVQMSRLLHPLTGDKNWVPLDGTVVVNRVWGGRANLAEINVAGPSGKLQFLSLRLYNPQAHQWSLNFAGSRDGTFGVPMIGEFKNGRGDFYDQEPLDGRETMVRFSFLDITGDSGRDEQAFSGDYGKTWEVNWINLHKRVK
ncbi:MAG TPA: hypothetical protein VGT99_08380 [Gammaproteobacteria bacterium]|nr:hypothetical protein [Gammaproteobacteria bacterium]